MSIVLNNAQISDFYHKHPDINIEIPVICEKCQ